MNLATQPATTKPGLSADAALRLVDAGIAAIVAEIEAARAGAPPRKHPRQRQSVKAA